MTVYLNLVQCQAILTSTIPFYSKLNKPTTITLQIHLVGFAPTNLQKI